MSTVNESEAIRQQLARRNDEMHEELEDFKVKLSATNFTLADVRRNHSFEVDDLKRQHRKEEEDMRDDHRREIERARRTDQEEVETLRKELQDEMDRLQRTHREALAELERKSRSEVEEERARRMREIQELSTQRDLHLQDAELNISRKQREMQDVRNELNEIAANLDRERTLNTSLKNTLTSTESERLSFETANRELKAKIEFLESSNQAQSQAFEEMHKRMQAAIDSEGIANEKLRAEETLRRKLHNQVQELKGNIRVFCRVRPTLAIDEQEAAKIGFPDAEADSKEVAVQGPEQTSAMGRTTTSTNSFSFDRVFGPSSENSQIFEEISQLVQSALDGYNVCIFCYGQTGSGKTHTMSSADGMIPLAVKQIYDTARGLEEKGWKYTMEGSFVEVYNENLNDLLGNATEFDKKKHEIRHDVEKNKTTITGVQTVMLDSPERLQSMLDRSSKNRIVAATNANQRSSRSHSVFILRLIGNNSITGEHSEGTLNLVDLAGSERLSHSQAEGQRLKETQNINKSLSCLGDVIGALGQGKDGAHVPYRNSKVSRTKPTPTKD